MVAESQDKIEAGAVAYLELCAGTADEREAFLNSLEHQLGWTRSEMLDLQILVAGFLLDRRNESQAAAKAVVSSLAENWKRQQTES